MGGGKKKKGNVFGSVGESAQKAVGKSAGNAIGRVGSMMTYGTVNYRDGKMGIAENPQDMAGGYKTAVTNVADPLAPEIDKMPVAPDIDDGTAQADQELLDRMRRNTGRASTMLTGSTGLLPSGTSARRTLMGA